MPKRKIHWTKKAAQQFNEAINYIRLDSDKRADKVKNTLLEKIAKLSDNAIVHRIDPYKLNNDGRWECKLNCVNSKFKELFSTRY